MEPELRAPIKGLISDMDGVLWLDAQAIGDLPAIFAKISSLDLRITLATNNATRTPEQYLNKLAGFGVTLESHQIVNSALAVAHYLKNHYPSEGVYIVGEQALCDVLGAAGYPHDEIKPIAVIGSLDREISYEKLKQATRLIRAGLPFIGTNPDQTLPTPNGLVPGAGMILAALEAASGVKPLILGKPSPEMYKIALERMRLAPCETLVIGDRLETDIAGAQQIGCQSALVLSGVTTRAAADAWQPQPDWVVQDLQQLLHQITIASSRRPLTLRET
jgi:4-nitrophenyl phosphatase